MSNEKILVNEARPKIKEARISAGMKQSDLGQYLSRSRTWVIFREREEKDLFLADLLKISQATAKPLAWFFQRDTEQIWEKRYQEMVRELEEFLRKHRLKQYNEMSHDELDEELKRLGMDDSVLRCFFMELLSFPTQKRDKVKRILESLE